MKFNKLFPILILAGALMVPKLHAQTNSPTTIGGITEILSSAGLITDPTNYAIVPFVGIKADGKQFAAGLLAVENVNNNLGVVLGFDSLWGGGKIGSANIISGGVTLKQQTHPLSFISTNSFFQNLAVTPYAVALVGTPLNGTSNDGGLAAIGRVGAQIDIYNFKGWEIGVGADYGNRVGAGNYSGNWFDGIVSIRKGF
jgi:hypothetical protein